MFLKGSIQFRFDDPPSICAPECILSIRTWFYAVEQTVQNKKVYGEEHDGQSHMFRPTITVMQEKYCGDRYDIYRIQKPIYKGSGEFFAQLILSRVVVSVLLPS